MKRSLRTLLAEIIDYAGIFPPAKLPLGEAIARYAEYTQGQDRWMLGRFVCPAPRLVELAPQCDASFRDDNPLSLTVIGSSVERMKLLWESVRADIERIRLLAEPRPERVQIGMYEMRLPADAYAASHDARARYLADAVGRFLCYQQKIPMSVAFEFDHPDPSLDLFHKVVDSIAEASERSPNTRIAIKLRFNAADVSFPLVPERVARYLRIASSAAVPLKATAGLHDPLTHERSDSNQPWHFGFVNLFVAGCAAAIHDIESDVASGVLQESDPAAFDFDDDRLLVHGISLTCEEIAKARREFMLGFGSCSFDEPREGLQRLGWW